MHILLKEGDFEGKELVLLGDVYWLMLNYASLTKPFFTA